MRAQNISVFCCYAHEDEGLLRDLTIHLQPLQRQGIIKLWADIHINAGDEWKIEIDRHLNTAQVILLLVSPDFMNSDYCYSEEMQRATHRHERGVARVVPIILRPVLWQAAPFGKLQVLPPQARPIVHPAWHSKDEAFLSIVEGIRQIAEGLSVPTRKVPSFRLPQKVTSPTAASTPPLQNTFSQQGSAVQISVGDIVSPTPSRQVSSLATPDTMINERVVLRQVGQGKNPPEWSVFRSRKISARPIIVSSIVLGTTTLSCCSLSSYIHLDVIIFLVVILFIIALTAFFRLVYALINYISYGQRNNILILLSQGFVYKYVSRVYVIHFAQIERINVRDKPERTLVLEFRKNALLPAKEEFQFWTLEDRMRVHEMVVSAYHRYKSFNSRPP